MIKNDRQYQTARRAADNFSKAIADFPKSAPLGSDIHPRLWQAERDAMASQLEDLRDDLHVYEELRDGKRRVLEIKTWSDVPRALIEGRIAAQLTQKDLAERLGLAEQAVQRYEATDYSAASLKRLQEVAEAIGLSLTGLVSIPEDALTPNRFLSRIKELGLSRDWFVEKLLPTVIAAAFSQKEQRALRTGEVRTRNATESVITGVVQAAELVRRVFQIDPADFLGSAPLVLDPAVVGQTRFKRPDREAGKSAQAYTFYAHYLALLVLTATSDLPRRPLPRKAKVLSQGVRERYGSLTFENSLLYVWSHGIPVLPLSDVGAFQGACWRVRGRDVIVLKQRTPSEDRWIYDLWHEVGHIVNEADTEEFAVVEEQIPQANDPRENAAMRIAGDVVLDGRADELAERAMSLVDDNVPFLKRLVPQVAAEAGVSAGALANHLAFRISEDSDGRINWWGAASKLQKIGRDPFLIARDVLIQRVNFGQLNPIDRDLLIRALEQPNGSAAV